MRWEPKLALGIVGTGFAVLGWAGYFGLSRVTVESKSGRRSEVRVSTAGHVRLVKQLSDAACTQGKSWGFTDRIIWVDHGCRAIFEYGEDRVRTQQVTVESEKNKRKFK